MAINCADAASGGLWPYADNIDNLKPTFAVLPWPCGGYNSQWDISAVLPVTAFIWEVVIDFGVGGFGGNPFTAPVPGTLYIMEIDVGFKAHIIPDAWFGLNPGSKITMTVTATELGGPGRVLANSIDLEDQS